MKTCLGAADLMARLRRTFETAAPATSRGGVAGLRRDRLM
jgi:hypothetical protein